uniref:Uncharacterized protein n=1 Tax=Arundo donax TaxID=35708 RepID=A0A0A9F6Z6_ARUDO
MKQLHPGGAVAWQRRSQQQLLLLFFWVLGLCSCSLQVVFMSDGCGYASRLFVFFSRDRFLKHVLS